ncbi:MAG: SprT family zinc-dependent metalloprotease [Candidatus Aegiribacteria sp.]
MEYELKAGGVTVPYTIRFSRRARRRRIVVRPGRVEVVAPIGDSPGRLHRLMHEKGEWVSAKLEMLRKKADRMRDLTTYQIRDGARVPYRGRKLSLHIHPADAGKVRIEYRSGFHVYSPAGAAEADLRNALDLWLKRKLRGDIEPLIRKYSEILEVSPGKITIRDMKTRWGSCGRNGNISLNLRLIHLSRKTLEYVVIHELCHLRHRNHSREFWQLVESVLPERIPGVRRLEEGML